MATLFLPPPADIAETVRGGSPQVGARARAPRPTNPCDAGPPATPARAHARGPPRHFHAARRSLAPARPRDRDAARR